MYCCFTVCVFCVFVFCFIRDHLFMKIQFVNIVRNVQHFNENVFTFSLNEYKHPLVKYVNGQTNCDGYLGNYGQYNLLTTNDEHSILKVFFMGYPISNKKCFDLYVNMKPDLVFSSMNPFINKYIHKMYELHQPSLWIHSSNKEVPPHESLTKFISVSRASHIIEVPEYHLEYTDEHLVTISKS